MHVSSSKFAESAKDFIKASHQEPVFIEDTKGKVKAVLLSIDEFQEFCEDQLWGRKALEAESEGFLSFEESLKFLKAK